MPDWYLTAMTQQRLGRPADARRWFEKAEEHLARRESQAAKELSLPPSAPGSGTP